MSIEFIKSGLQTSIQDAGRYGQMQCGISRSGAMDIVAMQKANYLVSKSLNAPIIECVLIGPVLKFHAEMSIGVSGATFELRLNGNVITNNETIVVKAGDELQFGKLQSGARAYLAFSDTPELTPVFNSYSTHLTAGFGGYQDRAFKDGDFLKLTQTTMPVKRKIPPEYQASYTGNYSLRCVDSIETNAFNEAQKSQFTHQSFKVSADSNRMGIRLQGEPLLFDKTLQITSSGLIQGSIQIPPSGQPIISSVDGQTIGGYPRIANIITADLPMLGQLKANDKITFVWLDKAEALKLLLDKQQRLQSLLGKEYSLTL